MALSRLKARFVRGRFASGVASVAGGAAVGQFLAVLTLPIISRLFPPTAMGVLAAYSALLLMLQTVAGLRYELAIPTEEDHRHAVATLLVSLLVVLVVSSGLSGLLLVLPRPALSSIEAVGTLDQVAWLLPVGVLLAGCYQSLRYWAIRERQYRDIGITTIAQGVVRAATQIVSGLLGFGPAGLILGEVLGQSAGTGKLAARPARALRSELPLAWGELTSAMRRNKSFALLLVPASLLNSAGMQVPTLLVVSFYGAEVGGLYFIAQRVMGLPVTLLSGAIGQVFLGETGVTARSRPDALWRKFRAVSSRLFLLGLLPTVVVILFAPWATAKVLGADWRDAGVYMQLLSLSFLLKFSFDGLINLATIHRNDLALLWAAIRLALACGAVVAAKLLGLPAEWCVGALGLALAAGYGLKLAMWGRAISQLRSAAG